MWCCWSVVIGVLAVQGTHGDPSPTNSKVVLRFHDAHKSRGSLEGHNDPSLLPRPIQGSVLDSLFELHHQDVDEDEDEDTRRPDPSSNMEVDADILEEVRPALHTILTNLQDDLAIPEITPTVTSNPNKPSLFKYLDGLRSDPWSHLRDMANGYLNLLEGQYEAQGLKEQLPLGLIRSVLQAGDQANLIKTFGEKLNPEVLVFLKERLKPLLQPLTEAERGTAGMGWEAARRVARVTFHHFIDHVLWVMRNHVTREELVQYRDDLRLKVPLAATGLDLLLRNFTSEEQGRSHGGYGGGGSPYGEYGSYDGYGDQGGYGGSSHGYGGSSNGYGVYLDPYLVLASLGAAALLAYLAFKVITDSTTTVKTRRRRRNDQLDDTDIPGANHAFSTSFTHGVEESSGLTQELDDLAEVVNGLWRERKDDPSCMSCRMTHYAHHHHAPARSSLTLLLA